MSKQQVPSQWTDRYREMLGTYPEGLDDQEVTDSNGFQFTVGEIVEEAIQVTGAMSYNAANLSDGGASRTIDMLHVWLYGLDKKAPEEFNRILADLYNTENDPEYVEYLRLKEKFK